MKKTTNILCLAVIALALLSACDRTKDPIYEKKSDDLYPVIVSNANLVTPSVPSAGYVKGTSLKIEFNFVQTNPIKEIQFLEKIGTADSLIIYRGAYAPAYSKTKFCDTLIYNYTVPTTLASGTAVVFRGRVVNQNGLTKDRTFSYKIK